MTTTTKIIDLATKVSLKEELEQDGIYHIVFNESTLLTLYKKNNYVELSKDSGIIIACEAFHGKNYELNGIQDEFTISSFLYSFKADFVKFLKATLPYIINIT